MYFCRETELCSEEVKVQSALSNRFDCLIDLGVIHSIFLSLISFP